MRRRPAPGWSVGEGPDGRWRLIDGAGGRVLPGSAARPEGLRTCATRLQALDRALVLDLDAPGPPDPPVPSPPADPEGRRREFAALVQGSDWALVHREKADFFGPFRLDHTADRTVLFLGPERLRTLSAPSGRDLVEAVARERGRLEDAARQLWPRLREALVRLQGPMGTVPWLTALDAAGAPRDTVLYALGLLRAGAMAPGWSLSTQPPSLAQQAVSVSLPRLDRPGSPDRVFALRVEGPPAGP